MLIQEMLLPYRAWLALKSAVKDDLFRQLAQNLYEIIKRQSQNDQIVKKKDITIEDINGLFREIKNKMKKDK